MSYYVFLPMVKANEFCERAKARYLRFHPGRYVRYSIPSRDLKADADGWVHLSNLADDDARIYFDILWDPATDNLRLRGPRK